MNLPYEVLIGNRSIGHFTLHWKSGVCKFSSALRGQEHVQVQLLGKLQPVPTIERSFCLH